MTVATALYRAVMIEIERRRLQLGWPMWRMDDEAGTNDGHYAHCLHADTPNGRQAQWQTLDLFVGALYPFGFDVEIRHRSGRACTAVDARQKIRAMAAQTDKRSYREMMRDLGMRGGRKSWRKPARKLPLWKRRAIARKAARARWGAQGERDGEGGSKGAGAEAVRDRPPVQTRTHSRTMDSNGDLRGMQPAPRSQEVERKPGISAGSAPALARVRQGEHGKNRGARREMAKGKSPCS